MNAKDFPFWSIISGTVSSIIKVFDNAYRQGWMFYLIAGLILFLIVVVVWN